MFKMQQFRLFAAIAEAGSINAAAEIVGLSQPALSKAVKEMERQLGVELMVRTSRGISLTPHGLAVARRANSIGRELERLAEEFSWLQGEIAGEVSVGITALGVTQQLANAISAFHLAHPKVRISVNEQRSDQILNLVRNGLLDCGILTIYGNSPPEGLEYFLIKSHEVAMVRGGRHSPRMSLDDAMACEWVDYIQEDLGISYISTLTRELGVKHPPKVLHCSSVRLSVLLAIELGAICHFVRGAIPAFRREIEGGRLSVLELDYPLPPMNLGMIHRDREVLSPAAREFAKLVRSMSSDHDIELYLV